MDFSVTDYLEFVAKVKGVEKSKRQKVIDSVVEKASIGDVRNKIIGKLSKGYKQRVGLAQSLLNNPQIVILDEPTAFLDLPNRYEIIRLLNELTVKKGKTIIFSSHDLNITLQEADKVWLMGKNAIIEGAPEDLIINKDIYRLFDNSNLDFNIEKGDFRLAREKVNQIGLSGEGIVEFWTRRALERIGYEVCDDKKSSTSIQISDQNGRTVWILMKKENKINCNSIYELTLQLRRI